ncbi:MAG: hypothetical protein R3192_03600 [Woeseiaceae bacterium]|nr:hypothetical protein [Woeseiaceae bacterium]
MIKISRLRLLPAVLFVLTGFPCVAHAQNQGNVDQWQYTLTPYLWLPRIDGNLNYSLPPGGSGSPNISVGPTDWLDLLNFAVLVSGSARKNDFVVFSDLVYLSMSTTDSKVSSVDLPGPGLLPPLPVDVALTLGTKSELDGLAWTLAAGYRIEDSSTSSMDAFAGVRYFGVDVSTRWSLTSDIMAPGGSTVLPSEGGVSSDVDFWDAIIGIRGQFDLTAEALSVPYYIDIGSGQSDLTWQAMAGVSWAFGWGDLLLVYRHLEYDEGSGGLLNNFSFSGPLVGARFSF